MTPHKDQGRGTFLLDRWVDGLGRLKRASGTDDEKIFARLNRMITRQSRRGERGRKILARLWRRHCTPMEFYEAGRAQDWSRILSDELSSLIGAALTAFLGTAKKPGDYEASTSHLANYRSAQKHIEAGATHSERVRDFPALLAAIKKTLKPNERMFNIVRSLGLTFARERFGQESALWRAIKAVRPYKAKRQRINHPATVVELRDAAARMEGMHAGAGKMAWTIATTGMRPVEYWGRAWTWSGDHLTVASAKEEQTGREMRLVPLVTLSVLPLPVMPTCWYGKFRKLLHAASNGQMQPYDLRRTYANWTEDARWDRTRFRLYFGHGAQDTTDIYQWRDVKHHMSDDATSLATWIEARLRDAENVLSIEQGR